MEYVLSVKGLKKSYRECQILRGVNLNVPEGCIYGLIGRNGAGKTTLFRVLTGLQRADEGTVGFNFDEKARKKRSQSCNMGAIIESPALYREMTAVDNMIEQSRLLGMKSYDPQPLLKLVGLDNTGKKKVKHFSLGMRQRLGIAISLVGNPKLLILDEPINGLDPDGIIEIRELINKLNKECGITIIISSHILAELAKVATVFGFLQDGELKKELTREELEQVLKKKTIISVTDLEMFYETVKEMSLDYSVNREKKIELYGDVDLSELVLALDRFGCRISSAQIMEENLESYYRKLMGEE